MIIFMLGMGQVGFSMQKILVIVDDSTNSNIYLDVYRYVTDIITYDYKKAESIVWHVCTGNNYTQCKPLWDTLQQRYLSALNDGDVLEGAVLIGNIPVPQQAPQTGYLPLDEVYMDIVDIYTGEPYNIPPFAVDANGYFTKYYGKSGYPTGDQQYDIWISRINAQYLSGGIRQGPYFNDERQIYLNYLDKVHNRMTAPANVPSRGFAMGPPEDLGCSLHDGLGKYFLPLNLPWLSEFTGGHNSSYNWMSQLLAGPRGCINYGAFNGTLFPSERNKRYCIYDSLQTVYLPGNSNPTSVYLDLSDSLGWEWAGVFGHSTPERTDFYSAPDLCDARFNGRFSFGTLGPLWGTNYRRSGGYNGTYFYYQDYDTNPNPYNRTLGWKEKRAQWRWWVKATKHYYAYVYYQDNPNNCNNVSYYLYPHMGTTPFPATIDQRTHNNRLSNDPLSPDYNWERIIITNPDTGIALTQGSLAIFVIGADNGLSGDIIADAVRFKSADSTVDSIVDDAEPSSYYDVSDRPDTIFYTKGFYTDDEVMRGYEDMGEEPGGGGNSKPQFYFMDACGINNFICTHTDAGHDPNPQNTIAKNLGTLYALGHNGLVCMGAADEDLPGIDRSYFTKAINNGMDFGEAFLTFQNTRFVVGDSNKIITNFYILLGAGSLLAQPYIQFGSSIEEYKTITWCDTVDYNTPVFIDNVTVNGQGTYVITSWHHSSSPFGTHAEIVIRPETDFAPTTGHEVHLMVN